MPAIVEASLGPRCVCLQRFQSITIHVLQVDGEFMAAVLLRRRQPPGGASSTQSPEAQKFAALELAALWVDPTLEDRAEVTCCLLVYLQQYLLAWDPVRELNEGAVTHLVKHPRRHDGYAACSYAMHHDGEHTAVTIHPRDKQHC